MALSLKKGVDYPGVCIVFFCHDGQGRFIMGKRSRNTRDEHGRWDTGGGGVEFGDSIEKTIHNEIQEEYCTTPLNIEFLGYRDVHREHNGQPTHWIALDFKVQIDPSQVQIGEPDMIDELGWYTLDTIPEPLHSQLPAFFTQYNSKLRASS